MLFSRIPLLVLLVSCGGNVVAETPAEDPCVDFLVLKARIDKPKLADGSTIESWRHIYVTFSAPARDVRIEVFESSSGIEVTDYFYSEKFYSPEQVSFALGTSVLKPLTEYSFTVSGIEPNSMCDAALTDGFKTADF